MFPSASVPRSESLLFASVPLAADSVSKRTVSGRKPMSASTFRSRVPSAGSPISPLCMRMRPVSSGWRQVPARSSSTEAIPDGRENDVEIVSSTARSRLSPARCPLSGSSSIRRSTGTSDRSSGQRPVNDITAVSRRKTIIFVSSRRFSYAPVSVKYGKRDGAERHVVEASAERDRGRGAQPVDVHRAGGGTTDRRRELRDGAEIGERHAVGAQRHVHRSRVRQIRLQARPCRPRRCAPRASRAACPPYRRRASPAS